MNTVDVLASNTAIAVHAAALLFFTTSKKGKNTLWY